MLRLLRLLRRLIALLMGAVLIALAACGAWVLMGTVRQDRARANAIVVLGAAQFDGEPSPVLENRLDRALGLYRSGVAKRIVTVGGNRPGDRFTEASAGRTYLLRKGVPARDVTAIAVGDDTYSSLAAVAEFAHAKGWGRLTVVTDRCHAARATSMLSSFNFTVYPAPPSSGPGSSVTVEYVAREALALFEFKFLQGLGQQERLLTNALTRS